MRNKEKESVENRSMKHYRDFLVLYMRSHLFRKAALFASTRQAAALLPGETTIKAAGQTDGVINSTESPQVASEESTLLPQGNTSNATRDERDVLKRHLWIHGQAIPLTDISTIRRAILIEGFFSGIRGYTDAIWPTIFYSLLAHDFYSYGVHLDDRYGNTWQKILLGSSSNQVTLTSYLNSFWWWQLAVFGAPFLFSAIQMLRQLRWPSGFSEKINMARLREEVASFSRLSFMTAALRWDRRPPQYVREHDEDIPDEVDVNVDECHPYLSKIIQTANDGHVLRKLYALSCLAEIVSGRDEEDLTKLIGLGVKDTIIAELRNQRSAALKSLRAYAGLSVAEGNRFENSLIHLYANYLLWSVGEKPSLRLEPIFLGSIFIKDAVVLYAKLRLLLGLIDCIRQAVTFGLNEKHCQNDHKVWAYIPAVADYECTVCGNWRDIYYPDMFSAQKCLDAILAKPRSAEEVLSLAQQLSYFNITRLDLSHQDWTIWDENIYSQIMRTFAQQHAQNTLQNRSFSEFNLVNFNPSTIKISIIPEGHARIINAFLQDVRVERLRLSGYSITTNTSEVLLPWPEDVPYGSMMHVDLSDNAVSSDNLATLLKHLSNSTTHLRLASIDLTDAQIQQYVAPALTQADELVAVDISQNQLSISGVNSLCAYLGTKMQELDVSSNDFSQSDPQYSQGNFTAFAKYLRSSAITKLRFSSTHMIDTDFISLFSYAPYKQLQYVDFSYNKLSTIAISQLAGNINGTDMIFMSFAGNSLGDKGITVLGMALRDSQVAILDISGTTCGDMGITSFCNNVPSTLKFLNVSHNSFDYLGIESIVTAITKLQLLTTLDLSNNRVYDAGIDYLAQISDLIPNRTLDLYLSNTKITANGMTGLAKLLPHIATLDLSQNCLENTGISQLAAYLNQSSIIDFRISGCNFDAEGATQIISAMPKTNIQKLDVSKNPIGDTAVLRLATTMITPSPSERILSEQRPSRDALRFISKTQAASSLEQLNLNGTSVTTVVARALCRVLPTSNVENPSYLGLAANDVDTQQIDLETCVTSAGTSLHPFGTRFIASIWRPQFTPNQLTYELIYNYNNTENLSITRYSNTHGYSYLDESYQYLRICFDLLPKNFTQEMLRSLLAIMLALRQELTTKVIDILPNACYLALQKQLPNSLTPEYQLLDLAAELIIRAQNTGISALVYDATLVTKYAYQRQAEQDTAQKTQLGKSVAEKLTGIATHTFFGASVLAGAYGVTRLVTNVTGSAMIGCLTTSLIFRAKKIANEVISSYKESGLLQAVDTAIDQIAFAFPGGGLIEQSLQRQSAAIARNGFFAHRSYGELHSHKCGLDLSATTNN